MNKREIRKMILARRDAIPQEQRSRASLMLAEKILGHPWFHQAKEVLCFVSYGSEISTEELIKAALGRDKKVFVPKVEGKDMTFYRITAMEELLEGYKGIREPRGNTERYEYLNGCDRQEGAPHNPQTLEKGEDAAPDSGHTLLIMPGVAFDQYRNRIGYGGGFYDRFLADKKQLQMHSIAVGFQCQMLEELPAEQTDIKPYQIICV